MSTATSRVERWEQRAEIPLMTVALVFLGAYAVPIVWPAVSESTRTACEVVVNLTWALFALDYAVRLWLAEDRRRFVRRNLFDLAIIVLPLLRPLRLLRLVILLRVLNRVGKQSLRGQVVVYAVGGAALLLLVGGLAVTEAEMVEPSSPIRNFGDGLWWAVTTMTTVGYGDVYPATTTGRFVAFSLMLGGVALLGVVTATLASWLVASVSGDESTSAPETVVAESPAATGTAPATSGAESAPSGGASAGEIAELVSQVQALRAEVAHLRGGGRAG